MENGRTKTSVRIPLLQRHITAGKYSKLGCTIAYYYLSKGYEKQKHIAESISISKTKAHEIMTGKRNPTPEHIADMIKFLELNEVDSKTLTNAALKESGWAGIIP